MASEPHRPGGVLRRAVDANLRYYEALGRLSVEYLQTLAGLVDDVTLPRLGGVSMSRTAPAPPAPPGPVLPRAASEAAPQAAALVLEAEHGGTATGLFMVQNTLSEKVSAPVLASPFRAEDGGEAAPKLVLDPEVVTLAPGEQMLVRVTTAIDEALAPGVSYRGELSVPGVAAKGIPLVLRRRSGDG
jgi:hypothetical protein